MKKSIENVTKSDDTSQPAMMRNQQPRINTLRSSSDTPEHLESASNTKNSLATSFAQQDSDLSEEQIESLKGFDKEGVGIVLDKIVHDAIEGYPDALSAISGQLASFSKDELKAIFQRSPHTLNTIAEAAFKGVPDALNAISRQLEKFSEGELKEIFQASPRTLGHIALAAGRGHQYALNAISQELAKFDKDELKVIFQASPGTLNIIAYAACEGHPDALNAISTKLRSFTKEELKGIFQGSSHTLNNIAFVATKGHPDALNAISQELTKFDKDELKVIFQNSLHTLNIIALAACSGHPDALNAISGQFVSFSKDELKAIFQRSIHTLKNIADAACEGHSDALLAISRELAKFEKDELKGIFQRSPHTLSSITYAAREGHSDALYAILAPLDGVMDLENQAVREYYEYLNDKIKHHLFSKPNRFLGLERAFRDLGTAAFARITTGEPSKIISQLEKSINWYKEFTAIFNQNPSDQAGAYEAEFQMQENLSARVCRFINDNVLQRDRDQTSREPRIDFVKNLCDYLTMMGHHHIVLGLSNICRTYQLGLDGYYGYGYADSVLDELSRTLAQPSGTSLFAASQESDVERDKRYKKAYGMLKSFNENLGLWIQFKPGRDPLSAQDTVVEHFKVLLRSYLNVLGDIGIDNSLDYDDVNCILKEKDWDAFLNCRNRFLVNESEDVAASSGSFQPLSHRP